MKLVDEIANFSKVCAIIYAINDLLIKSLCHCRIYSSVWSLNWTLFSNFDEYPNYDD